MKEWTGPTVLILLSEIYGAEHLDAPTFVQRPNRIDLDQKIKFNS